MTDSTNFRMVMRGYETAEVDRVLATAQQERDRLQQELSQAVAAAEHARTEAGERSVEAAKSQAALARLNEQVSALTAKAAEAESQSRITLPPSFAELGERIGSMLTLAEEEAAELLGRAKAEAEKVTADSTAAAEQRVATADRYAADTTSKADADGTRILETARRRADDLLDQADREATVRREEAEAVYERQRARAAAAAADFEQTLASRRDKAAEDFAAQTSAQELAIERAEERLAAVEAEADRTRASAETQARSAIAAADDEATALLEHARQAADKVRRESDRELQAATSRRDAITAQLTNVRQMLATLGGSSLVDALGAAAKEPVPSAEAAEEPEAIVEGVTEETLSEEAVESVGPAEGADPDVVDQVAGNN